MMDRALEMEIFLAVVDQGSFVAAADALRLSKAAVSRHVAALEERLGVRLLQRTTRRLSLTEEGRLFAQRAREILASLEEAESEVASQVLEPLGALRVNAPVSFGIRHLAPLWGEFLQQCPRIELDINLDDRLVDLLEDGYDLAVRIGRLESSSLVSRRLASTQLQVCASPEYLARHGTPSHPRELAEHRVIAYNHLASRDDWPFSGPQGELRVQTRAALRSNNGDTCLALGRAGAGILLQPDFMLYEDLRSGALVELMPEYRSLELGIYAVYPSRKQLPLKVRRLVEFLLQALSRPNWRLPTPLG